MGNDSSVLISAIARMSTFSTTTCRKLPIFFLIKIILWYENIKFFGLFKRSVLRLLLAMSTLLERSVIASSACMCVLKNHKFFQQYFRFLENIYYRLYLNVASSFIIIHINEAITLTISFQLVLSLFNLIFKISICPLHIIEKPIPILPLDFISWMVFAIFTNHVLHVRLLLVKSLVPTCLTTAGGFFLITGLLKSTLSSVIAPGWNLTLTKLFLDKIFGLW